MQSTLIEPSRVTLRTAPLRESKKGTFICMYTGIHFCVANIYNEYLCIFSKLF